MCPTPAKELSVVPETCTAAIPVDAVTNVPCAGSQLRIRRRVCDLPVPAPPVTKTLR